MKKQIAETLLDLILPKSDLPTNITITEEGDNLIIDQRWFSSKHFWSIISSIFISGIFCLSAIDSPEFEVLFYSFAFIVGSIGYGILGFINHSIITITPTTLSLICSPIPCFQSVTLNTNSITQLFVEEKIYKGKNSTTYRYTLYVLTNDGKKTALIRKIPKPKQIQYLETYIEEYLGIENVTVPKEYRQGKGNWQKVRDKNKKFRTAISSISYLQQETQQSIPKATGNYKGYHLTVETLPQLVTGINLTTPSPHLITNTVNNLPNLSAAPIKKPQPIPKKRLTTKELEALFSIEAPQTAFRGTVEIKDNGLSINYTAQEIITNTKRLESLFNRLSTVLDYYANIIYTGAESISILYPICQQQEHPFQETAIHLLEIISQQTISRFEAVSHSWICSSCLNNYIAYKLKIKLGYTLTYYACKGCGKSHTARKRPKQVILILDNTIPKKWFQANNALCINWFHHKTVFDFDAVKITAATDEDIERLAIQVGNDTDPIRKERYKQLPCIVDPTCILSENSLKLLERSFQIKS